MRIFFLCLIIIAPLWACTQKGASSQRSSAGKTGLTGNSRSGTVASPADQNTAARAPGMPVTSTATGASSEFGVPNPTSESTILLTQEMLSKMSLDQVRAYYDSNMSLLDKQKQKLSINGQIATGLCLRLQQLNRECSAASPLVPDGGSGLICVENEKPPIVSTESPFKAAIVDTSGHLMSTTSFPGRFILVANGLYESTPFGAGPATGITFSFKGSGNQPSPLLMQITTLELRSADDTVAGTYSTKILAKTVPTLPPLSSFYAQFFNGNNKLVDGPLLQPTNAAYENYRYRANLATLTAAGESKYCKVTAAEINDIKSKIAESIITADTEMADVNKAAAAISLKDATKEDYIAGILDAQNRLATALPLIQNEENRILNFTGEIQVYQTVGCHASEPIQYLTIEVFGKKNDPKLLTDNWDTCPVMTPQGPSSTLQFSMGPSVKVDIDTSKVGVVGGSPWKGAITDQALVASIRYLKIAKLGVGIVDSGQVCKVQFGGLSRSCARTCEELDTFSITGVKIKVDTPSRTGATIYDNESLNVTLGSPLYSPNATISWATADLRADPNFVKFMSETDCDATR